LNEVAPDNLDAFENHEREISRQERSHRKLEAEDLDVEDLPFFMCEHPDEE
jgi:hypothetical protein